MAYDGICSFGAICLLFCYAMCGTERAYGATGCVVLSERMVLQTRRPLGASHSPRPRSPIRLRTPMLCPLVSWRYLLWCYGTARA
eukprot:3788404-Rhodomonas_salina.2